MKIILEPILKNRVRILRPSEYKLLEAEVIKQHHRIMLQTLLFSGMRFIECKRFQEHPEWYDGNFIKITLGEGVLKEKIRQKERWIRLNALGKMVIPYYLELEEKLPSNQTWRENIRRWAENAGFDPIGLCPKTTRKTWESWLMFFYENKALQILQSQGHTGEISLKHYLNFPFTQADKMEMAEYVSGWI